MQNILENMLKSVQEEIKNNYLKPEHIVDARVFLGYHLTEEGAECISALCDISYKEAKEIVDNYRKNENRGAYIVCVAAMLQQKAEEKKLIRYKGFKI